jgi:hypothetical protein
MSAVIRRLLGKRSAVAIEHFAWATRFVIRTADMGVRPTLHTAAWVRTRNG